MARRTTRRAFLRTGGTLASIGATSLVAGCQAGPFRIGRDRPSAAIETVERWSPAPDESGRTFENPIGSYSVRYADPGAIIAANDRVGNRLLERPKRRFRDRFALVGVPYEAVGFHLDLDCCQIIEWDHDPATLASRLESAGYGWAGQHRRFDMYAQGATDGAVVFGTDDESNRGRIFAFDGTHLIHARHGRWTIGKAKRTIKLVVDAHAGVAGRLIDTDRYARAMLATANPGHLLRLRRTDELEAPDADPKRGRFEGTVGICTSNRFGSDAIQHQTVYAFANARAVDMAAVEEYVDAIADGETGAHVRNVAVDRHGRLVEITFDVPFETTFDRRASTGLERFRRWGVRTADSRSS